MMTWEMDQAEYLVRRWRAGDGASWLPLEDLIKKRLVEDIEQWLNDLGSDDVAWLRASCLEIYRELRGRRRFVFEKRTNFQEICAHALRKVIIEMARRVAEKDSL